LFDVSNPKKSVVTTDDERASVETGTICGSWVLSLGSCAAFARKSAFAEEKYLGRGALLA